METMAEYLAELVKAGLEDRKAASLPAQTPSTPPRLYRRTTDTCRHTPAGVWAGTRSYNKYKASCLPTRTPLPAASPHVRNEKHSYSLQLNIN